MNVVVLSGRLGKDPEVKKTNSGKSVMTIGVAVRKKGSEDPEWINVVCWEKTADFLGRYAHKGDQVVVLGRLATRRIEAPGGVHFNRMEVMAVEVELDSKRTAPIKAKTEPDEMEEFAQQYREADPLEEDLPW